MTRFRPRLAVMVSGLVACAGLSAPAVQQGVHTKQGSGIVIELDNAFIAKLENRVTLESEFTPIKMSAPHPIGKSGDDGEVHIGGWADAAGLATVAEIMNVATPDARKPKLAFSKAITAGQTLTVTGVWRLWCEHGGLLPQTQAVGPKPAGDLPGTAPSNPDHVFELHPVTQVKAGGQTLSALDTIRRTPGYTTVDAHRAFVEGYDRLPCKLVPVAGADRTRLITKELGFNFVEFIIRLEEKPVPLADGHACLASVFDTDGELLVRRRRMVFVAGTEADDHVQGLDAGQRMRVFGMPRISLKLVAWRLKPANQVGHDISPLEWTLPYEMVVLGADHIESDD